MTKQQKQNSGMCIPCSVRSSPGKGSGVFSDTELRAGETVWRHLPGQYEVLDEESFASLLAESSQDKIVDLLDHIVSVEEFPGYMVRHFDESALINHSDEPNVKRKNSAANFRSSPAKSILDVSTALQNNYFDLVVARDLAIGDELLMDYNIEPDDPEYYEDACRRYGVTWEWL